MADDIKNFAIVDVVGNGQSASATSIRIEGGHAARLPTAPFNAVWWNWTVYRDYNDDPNVEIVRVTAISSSDVLTITRAQEGTTASAKSVGGQYKLEAFATARTFEFDVPSEVPTKASGSDINTGTNDTNFLTPKSIADSSIPASITAKVDKTTTVNGHALSSNVTVSKSDVGLGSVDNTSDVAKPISTAAQTALDLKVATSRTVAGHALSSDVTLVKGDVGLGNVDNVADSSKPVSTAQAAADTAVQNSAASDATTKANSAQTTAQTYADNLVSGKKTFYKFVYDFSVLGGAQGTIPLTQANGTLPNNFIVQNVLVDVITPLGSAGLALIAATTGQSAGDLIAAAAVGGAPWSSTGLKATLVLLGTVATQIKTTATRTPALVVSIADLNAGKLNIFLEGYLSS